MFLNSTIKGVKSSPEPFFRLVAVIAENLLGHLVVVAVHADQREGLVHRRRRSVRHPLVRPRRSILIKNHADEEKWYVIRSDADHTFRDR